MDTPYTGLYGEAPPKRGTFLGRCRYVLKGTEFMRYVEYIKGQEKCHLGI